MTFDTTNIACACTRCGSPDGSEHSFTDSEIRKKPGPRHVARPSENRPWCGHQKQDSTDRVGTGRGHAGTGLARRMATQTRPDHRNTAYDARITTDGHTHGRAQGTSENSSYSRSEPEPTPASSGWLSDATPGRLFHTSPSRCWWRAGGFNPSEYGNAGAHPSARPISRGAAARESRLISDTFHKTLSVQHDAFNTHGHVGPTGIPPTMGRSHASAG